SVQVKGLDQPVEVWRVGHEETDIDRFEALRGGAATRFVAREAEIALLLARWQQAKSGAGQVVLITAEAGIGKSRLVTALIREHLTAGADYNQIRYFCSPQHVDSALHPVIAQLERSAGIIRIDESSVRLGKLEALLEVTSASREDVALLAELLSLPA